MAMIPVGYRSTLLAGAKALGGKAREYLDAFKNGY
jgi:hypothetical protein